MPPAPEPQPAPSAAAAPLTWGDALRAVRLSSGVTQSGWAARLGVSRATVQRWEAGEAVPSAEVEAGLIALCRERGLFRRFDRGPLAGLAVSPECLRALLAEARLGPSGAARPSVAAPATPPASAPSSDLPAPLSSFIGRAWERGEVRRLLGSTRLLTLTGPGGIGKTRLALHAVSRTEADETPLPPVSLVELAPVAGEADVQTAVARALQVPIQPGRPVEEALVAALRDRTALLLLDNCEHVIAACATLVARLLRATPGLRVLATSREPLGVSGEIVWRVPPLSLPAGDTPEAAANPVAALLASDAARLFTERARAVRSGFAVTPENARAIGLICHRLDGIPLALELAAARITVLSAEQIAARLDDRFRLLAAGSRDAAARQQTLRAVMDWSHDLLREPDRVALRRLGVFGGSASLEAVEAVLGAEADALDVLARLVDRSLVQMDEWQGAARYRLLETVREYALERLRDADEVDTTHDRLLTWAVALTEEADAALRSPGGPRWLDRLDQEHANLRVAIEHALGTGQPRAARRIGAALWRFWLLRGHAAQGRAWLEGALTGDGTSDPLLLVRTLDAAGALAHALGDYPAARARFDRSLPLWESLNLPAGIAGANTGLGLAAKGQGELATALAAFERALALYRELGQPNAIAQTLNNLSAVAIDSGDWERAEHYQEESLALKRGLGDPRSIAVSLNNLAEVAAHRGDLDRAAALLDEGAALLRAAGDTALLAQMLHSQGAVQVRRGEAVHGAALLHEGLALARERDQAAIVALCLEGLAEAALAREDPPGAARLLGAAEALRGRIGAPLAPSEQGPYDMLKAAVCSALGEAVFAALLTEGRVHGDGIAGVPAPVAGR